MKSIGKIMSACALFVAVSACHGQEIKQKITVRNDTGDTIFGGVYLTNAAGKVYNAESKATRLTDGSCRSTTITKSQKVSDRIFKYHRLIFSTDEQAIKNKIKSNSGTNVFSSSLKQLTTDTPLYYTITTSIGTFTGKKELKISKVKNIKCTAVDEFDGRLEALGEAAGQILGKASAYLSTAFSSKEPSQPTTPVRTPKKPNPKTEEIRARQAKRMAESGN